MSARNSMLVFWIAFSSLVAAPAAMADEGMWTPWQLEELSDELEELGLDIPPESLGDLTGHPMGAVVSLGGCTASFVSPQGLVVTNHHCAYGAIQYNSTEENNLLRDGFLARSYGDEVPAGPGSRVLVTVAFDDVTEPLVGDIAAETDGAKRYSIVEERQKEMVAECEKDDGHRCRVASYYGGLQYFLIKQLEIRDVRLVYAPAGPIGKYGGDVDNWIWPRHTGDFAFYRAYVAADGSPADHSEDNVPYAPVHHLEVSRDDLDEGDLVMIAGYPGSTQRYRMAEEADEAISWRYPTLRGVFADWLDIIARETEGREDAEIKYASTVASLNNVNKNYQGMLEGFAKSDIIERKRANEEGLTGWIGDNPELSGSYGGAVDALEALVEERQATRDQRLFYDSFAGRSAMLSAARTLYRLSREREKPDAERKPGYQERDETRIRESMTRIDRTYDPAVDREIWRHFILKYAAMPADQHVSPFDRMLGIGEDGVDEEALDALLDEAYSKTVLGDAESRLALLEASREDLEKSEDPFIRMAVAMYDTDRERESESERVAGEFQKLRPRYMAALIRYNESRGRPVYPDANGTLRVSYGTISGYSPRDAVSYGPFTTAEGILEKDTGVDPFDSPKRQLELIREGRFGGFVDPELSSLPVNFLSTVDSTGGNSGSPTLDAKGRLIGLLFDGNYESINADWDFNVRLTRSIHVDIRYALWVMEQVDGADELLAELGFPREAAGVAQAAPAEGDLASP